MRANLAVRLAVGSVLVALCLAGLAGAWRLGGHSPGPAHAQDAGPCSLSTLNGSYGVLAHGTVFLDASGHAVANGATRVDASELELVTFDGQGNLVISHSTVTVNGQVSQLPGAGTYTLNPDCTGTTTVGGATPAITLIVVVDGGNQVELMQTDSGYDVTGTATRQ